MAIVQPVYLYVVLTLAGCSSFVFAANATKSTTPSDVPMVIPQPRLPSYTSIESNVTDSYMDVVSAKAKKIIDAVKEVHEITDEKAAHQSFNRTTPTNYESSSTISSENYITIGEYPKKANFNKYLQSGFKPFSPSPLFVPEPEYKIYSEQQTAQPFKSSVPAKPEQFYQPYQNNYPTYGGLQNDALEDSVYAKYYDKQHQKLPFITTTYSPPIINPMYRPSIYKKKKSPFLASSHYDSWTSPPYPPFTYGKYHHGPEFAAHLPEGYVDQGHLEDDPHNVYHKPHFVDKPRGKSGLLSILTTLIPLGLLLSALPPRVIFINSTIPQHHPGQNKPYFRNLEEELLQIHNINDTAYNLVQNIGLEPFDDPICNKHKICETALRGSDPMGSFEEYSLWHLLSRSSDTIRTSLNLQDVFEAVVQKQCSKFVCPAVSEEQKQEEEERGDSGTPQRDINDVNESPSS